jgi:hypothetical protein
MEKASTSPRRKIFFGTTFSHKHLKKLFSLTTILAIFLLSACKKEIEEIQKSAINLSKDQVSADILEKIGALGFGTKGVIALPDGYLVEGDIILSKEDLKGVKIPSNARIDQYRTTQLVTNLPRTIMVSIASSLPARYVAALDEAIQRYNDQGIQLSLSRVASGANISIVSGSGSYLASAGFPSGSGNPYREIKINATAIGPTPNVDYLATILAHEIGHCIGFRHTDYMDRSYSCGGSYSNEGPSTVGQNTFQELPLQRIRVLGCYLALVLV